jgi:hypothetical protein
MANTYTLIASNTLSSSAASVTFSSIPSTYTDLVLKYSARTDESGSVDSLCYLRFNSSSASNYSVRVLRGSGSVADSLGFSSQTYIRLTNGSDAVNATSSTFANGEIYIPSYTVSQNKPLSAFTAMENNATEAYLVATAGLWSNTSAITSITVGIGNAGVNFVSGSSFFLYGIKNS